MFSTNFLLLVSMLHTLVSTAYVELFAGPEVVPEEARQREAIMADETDYQETLR